MELLYSLSQFFFSSAYIALQFLIILVEIRYLTNWFLNVNPFFEPFVTLWAWTNPVFNFGRRWYPRIFGLDITPIINYKALNTILQIVEDLAGFTPPGFESAENGNTTDELSINTLDVLQHHIGMENISHYLSLSDSFFGEFHNLIY